MSALRSRLVVFGNPGFPSLVAALFLGGFAIQIQTVAVGWQVYDLTGDPFQLGLVGLSQFAPALALVLFTGAVSDRLSRRLVMSTCLAMMAFVAGGLAYLAWIGNRSTLPIFTLILMFGAVRAFYNPARQSIVTNIVEPEHLPRALATNNSAHQIATICGPVAGGLLYGLSPVAAYGMAFLFLFGAAVLIIRLPRIRQQISRARRDWSEMMAGFRFIREKRIILGAISLDLFVVLLGGAIALLPVYARDVLDIGSVGLGFLRAAPALGAVMVGLFLIGHPITRNAGRIMFAAVAGFAVFTFVFALSKVVWLSVLCLILIGAFDVVSVLIRSTLIQLHTPDDLRGRVNAVNQVFIGASNEVGGFRAGTTAALFGPVLAVAGGAIVALGICGVWYRAFPELREVAHLGKPTEDATPAAVAEPAPPPAHI
ncbi:MFS transporter [Chelativorans xinjiangense]|uniref:MFS transporter n=1 Tax=Chelativorans xinjiangense TaxID=2681485 RepID=UPI00135A8B9E|nr:MFS transporter [Chelativorans xinjiangense]